MEGTFFPSKLSNARIELIFTLLELRFILYLNVPLPSLFSDKSSIISIQLDKEISVLNPESRSVEDLDNALLSGVVRHPDSADLSQNGKIKKYKEILCFLGYSTNNQFWNSREILAIFDPRVKLNNQSTINQIPNIKQIRKQFGMY